MDGERVMGVQATMPDLARQTVENAILTEEVNSLCDRIAGEVVTGTGNGVVTSAVVVAPPLIPGNPFQRPVATEKRLKLFLWGPSGSFKTRLALAFPGVALIDLEHGADLYSGEFAFERLENLAGADDVARAVDWLATNRHSYLTLVIDPITIYWEMLQRKWSDIFLARRKESKGFKHEFYDMQFKDWSTLKADLKEFFRKLLALDMNVVVTAREKALYADGEMARKIGETFDGEKSLPYLFDVVLRLRAQDGHCVARVEKDRTNRLPQAEFPCDFSLLARSFGGDILSRASEPISLATPGQKEEVLDLAKKCGMSDDQIGDRLANYGAASIDDLTQTNAEIILGKLRTAVSSPSINVTK